MKARAVLAASAWTTALSAITGRRCPPSGPPDTVAPTTTPCGTTRSYCGYFARSAAIARSRSVAVDDGGGRVRPDPPQPVPVVVVHIDQERHPRVRGDVVQPAQRRRRLRFVIDGEHHQLRRPGGRGLGGKIARSPASRRSPRRSPGPGAARRPRSRWQVWPPGRRRTRPGTGWPSSASEPPSTRGR